MFFSGFVFLFSELSELQTKKERGSYSWNTKSLPAKGAAVTSLCHCDQCVGHRGPNVGAHDDRNSHLDCKHCQSTQFFLIISPRLLSHPSLQQLIILQVYVCMHMYLCVYAGTHIQRRPCWQLWRRKWMSSGPAKWPEHQWPDQPEGWTKLSCPEICLLQLYLDKVNISKKCLFTYFSFIAKYFRESD